jgi:hypothetical protein
MLPAYTESSILGVFHRHKAVPANPLISQANLEAVRAVGADEPGERLALLGATDVLATLTHPLSEEALSGLRIAAVRRGGVVLKGGVQHVRGLALRGGKLPLAPKFAGYSWLLSQLALRQSLRASKTLGGRKSDGRTLSRERLTPV